MTEASASVCLILATALLSWSFEAKSVTGTHQNKEKDRFGWRRTREWTWRKRKFWWWKRGRRTKNKRGTKNKRCFESSFPSSVGNRASVLLHNMAGSKDILFRTPSGQLLQNKRTISVTNIAEQVEYVLLPHNNEVTSLVRWIRFQMDLQS